MMLRAFRSRRPARGLLFGLLVGLLATGAATALRAALHPLLGPNAPYITYFPALVFAAWIGGPLAGATALLGGALAAVYFFILPHNALWLHGVDSLVGLVAFVVAALALVAIVFRWRRTEDALLHTKAVLVQAGEIAHLGAWTVEFVEGEDPTTDTKELYWSDETYRIFGYEPESVVPTNQLFFSRVHPDDRSKVREAAASAVANRRPYGIEHRIVRPDGAERVVFEHAQIECDQAGDPCLMIGAVQDVTEQRRTEQIVREASDRLRRIVEHIHDALIMDDAEGRLVFANDRFLEMFGFSASEIGQVSLEDYVAPQYREVLRERHERRVRGESVPTQFEYEGLARDGRRMWIEVHVVPVLDDRGHVIGTQSALREVTDRKRAEEALRASEETARRRAEELERLMAQREHLEHELRQKADQLEEANRLKDEFIATVSHELRTPLNAMLGWAELLRGRRLAGAAEERALQVIASNARRQAQLIEDLLDLSRIVVGKLRLEPQLLDPGLPVHAAIEAVLPSAEAKGLMVRGPAPTPGAVVFADAARLQQVVWNLLTNAVKFTSRGGTIGVDLTVNDGHVDIVVSDTGSGIAPDFLPHVFDRFRQADGRATRTHGGLGIGLSIVRHLVEAQGGRVRAESEGENKGATFIVSLPMKSPADAASAGPTPRCGDQGDGELPLTELIPGLSGLRVLAVDDEPDARELTGVILRQSGAEVISADCAAAALEALQRQRPDVLVIDIAMPGTDGYELLQRIRRLGGHYSRIPAIALTAYAHADDRRRALATGFHLHLAKPVEGDVLVRAVAGARTHTLATGE